MMSLIAAADVVVADTSYRKICEVLALRRRAVVVPGTVSAHKLSLRAQRLAELGLIRMVSRQEFGPHSLIEAVGAELGAAAS